MPPSASTWLIIEPTIAGHHYTYLEHIVAGAFERGIRVVVGVGTDPVGEEIEGRLRAICSAADLQFVRTPLPIAAAGPVRLATGMIRWWRFMAATWRAAIASRPIDFVFVPYLDYALFAIALLGSPFGECPFGGITMRQRFHFRAMGIAGTPQRGTGWRRSMFLRLLALPTLSRVIVIDESLVGYLERHHRDRARKVAFMPDPSDPPRFIPCDEARASLGLPAQAVVVLLYGYIDARKGVPDLLEWAAEADDRDAIHVVLAGKMDADGRARVADRAGSMLRAKGRLHLIDRYVTNDEEQVLLSAADWVWLAYPDVDLMSGVLVKAAQHGRGVLFRDAGLIGHFAKRYGSVPGVTDSVSLDAGSLPDGVEMRVFGPESALHNPLPDHSWKNACSIIFRS